MKTERIKINTTFEVRNIGEGEEKQTHLQGYALTFDSLSEDLGYFREIIRKGALDNCKMDNVVLNVNHDMDKPLARNNKGKGNGIGTLTLTVDEKGLFFDAIPTDTSYSRDLISNMEAGIIDKCSFAFMLDWQDDEAQTWDWDTNNRGYDLRTINKIKEIFDVSIVTNPAYESTSCTSYKRAKEDLEKERNNEIRKRKLKLELDLI
ncbi:HK97 family phage prohead protease [uncultured Clostridium sp.]|uniref:HK97 family phage prohead protease n=1 Tax=uncultured Clostridium sp. TaxID=59620 RepID=UPI0025DA18D5|nr:HK97 family phage prohead protease [uncultured Clostridium sp.]MDU4882699.1 HK97 family phage prohead protease [Clostridium celatum]MDU7076031.1 HK97 family phage prohead protease [Clostridium celatum]